MLDQWTSRDLRFVAETLIPERRDVEQIVNLLRDDQEMLEDYERYGRSFYQLTAEHKRVPSRQLQRVLVALSERFILAKKPLAFLAERYLSLRKHHLFEL